MPRPKTQCKWRKLIMFHTPLRHKWKLHFKTGTIIGKWVTVETILGNYKKSNEINPGFI